MNVLARSSVWTGLCVVALAAGCGTDSATPDHGAGADRAAVIDSGTVVDRAAGKDSGVTGDSQPQKLGITIAQAGKEVAPGSTYYIPMNTSTTTVALFSEQRDLFTIKNVSSAAVTLNGATIKGATGVVAEEFGLQTADLKPVPLDLANQTLAPGATKDFYVRFYPVAGGARSAAFDVTFNGSAHYAFTVTGHGQTAAAFFSGGTVDWTKIYGGSKSDEMTTTLVADAQGNLYFAANAKEVVDKFSYDLLIGQVKADGSLGWAKVWNGPYRDSTPDPGQNDESGGSANAMSFDSEGNLYLAASRSVGTSNNLFQTLVLKLNPKDGSILWEKVYSPLAAAPSLAKHNAQAYAVDASGKYVYVTGSTGSNTDNSEAHVMLIALNKADGSLYFKKSFEVFPTYNDRGYCLRQDGKGALFIGGNGSGDATLLKVSDVETTTPKLLWAKKVALGTGGNINAVDVDSAGNAYLALDRRGATTYFSAAKVDGTGALVWGKTYQGGGNSDASNVHVVKVQGSDVYLGGRIAMANFDSQMGDGLAVKLKDDGSLIWSMFHFSGKGPDELAEHRVKGIAVNGSSLFLGVQVYTGSYNGVRYSGYWYNGLGTLDSYQPTLSAVATAALVEVPDGTVKDATSLRGYADAPASLVFQDATAKKDGTPPDAELFLTKITLK